MKRPLPAGRTHLVLTGVELLRRLVRCAATLAERAKLAAPVAAPLIPPPKLHLLRFHGVLAQDSRCGRWWCQSRPRRWSRKVRRRTSHGRARRRRPTASMPSRRADAPTDSPDAADAEGAARASAYDQGLDLFIFATRGSTADGGINGGTRSTRCSWTG